MFASALEHARAITFKNRTAQAKSRGRLAPAQHVELYQRRGMEPIIFEAARQSNEWSSPVVRRFQLKLTHQDSP